jgi:uncharacterized protein with HEPN domain
MIDRQLAVYLDSMRKAVVRAITLSNRMTEEQFSKDVDAQAATAMYFIVVGEAAIKITQRHPEFVSSHVEWPWDLMRGLRNRIVHSYDSLHVPTMWETTTRSLPELLSRIDALGSLDANTPPHTGT